MAPSKTLIEQIGEAAGLAPHIGVKSSRASLNDDIVRLALSGLDASAIVAQLGQVKVTDGYRRERPVEHGDVHDVMVFIRAARQRLHDFDRQQRDFSIRAVTLAELLK